MTNRQKYSNKFFNAIFLLVLLKILSIIAEIVSKKFFDVIINLVVFVVIAFVIFIIISMLNDNEGSKSIGGKGNSGRGFALDSAIFDKIRSSYENLAQKYIDEKDYRKAAGVYMNLLKDNYRAASTLYDGGFYNEAAVVYLKKLDNKAEAANCYEMANQIGKAIELRKELSHFEKVGDLYLKLNDRKAANTYYQMVVDDYLKYDQMVQASLVYRKKMELPDEAQKILLQGWNRDLDPFNCINNYFANIFDLKLLESEIQNIYKNTNKEKKTIFLSVMKYEFSKSEKLHKTTRNIAYEIISENVASNPDLITELNHFNPNDKVVAKDIIRFRAKKSGILNQ